MYLTCCSLLLSLQTVVGAAPAHRSNPEPPPDWGKPVRLGTLSTWTTLAATSPDGRELVFTRGRKVAIYDLTAGKVRLEFTTRESLHGAAISPDGKLLVTSEWRDGFKLRDYRTGKILKEIEVADSLGASKAGFTPDGSRIVAHCYGGTTTRLWVYDVKAEKVIGWPAVAGRDSATRLVRPWLHGFGSRLLVSDRESENGRQTGHKVWLADADTGKEGRPVKLKAADFFLFDVSPDGKRLLCMEAGESPRIVDLTTGKDVCSLTGHKRWVTSAAYSPDGRRIVSASGTTTNGYAMALTKERPPSDVPTEVLIRSGDTGRVLARWSTDPALDFYRVGFSGNGRYIHALTNSNRELWLWGRLPTLAAQRDKLPTED